MCNRAKGNHFRLGFEFRLIIVVNDVIMRNAGFVSTNTDNGQLCGLLVLASEEPELVREDGQLSRTNSNILNC